MEKEKRNPIDYCNDDCIMRMLLLYCVASWFVCVDFNSRYCMRFDRGRRLLKQMESNATV
jgi:hypothetical protein